MLSPIVARRVVIDAIELEHVRTAAGDLDRRQLATVMNAPAAVRGVAKALAELAGARRTIAFAVDVDHAHALADALNVTRPGMARAIDGTASTDERRATLRDFESGAFQVLANCALFVEGFDSPAVACVAIARPTKSRALYAQMIGRGTRRAPGKADCLVLDFTGSAGRHRLIGPADCLAGDDALSDEVRAEIDALLAAGVIDVNAAIEFASAQVVEADRLAIVSYTATEIDPFVGDLAGELPIDLNWSADLATTAQRKALEDLGLAKLPTRLSRGEAGRWLSGLAARRARGLFSLKQARWLRRHGHVHVRRLSAGEASELIGRGLAAFNTTAPGGEVSP
ncbi:MAG: helicase-related protein [Proteobacteria bacterium]|nr:helicase-related protein [Pseudomonadota bacterium]